MSKRLLFLIHSLAMGGAERVTVGLAHYWADRGYTVGVATISGPENDFYPLDPRVERIALHVAQDSPNHVAALVNNLRTIRAVRCLLRQWQPHTTIALMDRSNVYLALASWGLPGKKIGSERIHPPKSPTGRVWETLRHWSYGRLDALVAMTELSANWLSQNTRAKNLVVIANPVPWPFPTQSPFRDPEKLLQVDHRYVLAVGRLVEQKGFDLLLESFASLALKNTQWNLVILGDGELLPEFKMQIEKLELQDRVLMPGKTGNIGDWYSACDLYVMSSRFEGFGNTLVEAMAYGLPSISFDCDAGPRDIIRHDLDGLLVPDGDVVELARAMNRLMNDESYRLALGAKAIEVRTRFSLEKIAAQWESLFAGAENTE